MNNIFLKKFGLILAVSLIFSTLLNACGSGKERILIYTSTEDFIIEDLNARLNEEFPDYDIIIEYMSTGNHAAKLLSEGTATDCDIIYNLEYTYLKQLADKGILSDLSQYDSSVYLDEAIESCYYLPQQRNGGAVILNLDVLSEKGLSAPDSYEDLLKPEYANLISIPNPKASGTGYIFLKSLVNAWGENATFEYFDKLAPNVLQFTSSGSGPVNALVQGEAAIGLGMTSQAVIQINNGSPLEIVFFEEGSPYTFYGQAMIAGKEERECVKQVFDFLINSYGYEFCQKFSPEPLFSNYNFTLENHPENICYSDMSSNTSEEKTRLLDMWKY